MDKTVSETDILTLLNQRAEQKKQADNQDEYAKRLLTQIEFHKHEIKVLTRLGELIQIPEVKEAIDIYTGQDRKK